MNNVSTYKSGFSTLQIDSSQSILKIINIDDFQNQDRVCRKQKECGYVNIITSTKVGLPEKSMTEISNKILKDEETLQKSSFNSSNFENSQKSYDKSNYIAQNNKQQAILISNQQLLNMKDNQDQILLNYKNDTNYQATQNSQPSYNQNQYESYKQNIQENCIQNDIIKFYAIDQQQLMSQNSLFQHSSPTFNNSINQNQYYNKQLKDQRISSEQLNLKNIIIHIDEQDENKEKIFPKTHPTIYVPDNQIVDNYSNDLDQSIEVIDKNELNKSKKLKAKKISKNKNEKTKQKEQQISQRKRNEVLKQKSIPFLFDQNQNQYLILSKPVLEKIHFFVFCDICIEDKAIKGNRQQTKRSHINQIKQVQQIIKHKNSNLLEVTFTKSQSTLMEFENYQKILLSFQDQSAKNVSDSLSNLQNKSRLAFETIQMIQSNSSVYEYILKRRQHSEQAYENFKKKTLPQHKHYFYNRYMFDLTNGNYTLNDVCYSQDFMNFLSINTDNYEQMVSKFGFIEFFKQTSIVTFKINLFSQFIFNMKNMPKVISYPIEFITLDNIEIKLDVVQHQVDLCKDFDELNGFECPFIDFIFFMTPQITDQMEESLSQIRQEQNIDINTILEMDYDEIDFYYNLESQKFMKKYYSDIYSRHLNIPDLSQQKVDYTHNKK